MKTINERVVYLIDTECSGNKSAFARQIGITPAYAAQIYKMERVPSDRTISDICRIFDIQEDWLRHGLEPMRAAKSREEEIADLVGSALTGSSEFKKSVIRMICSRTDEELKALEAALQAVYDGIKKDQG
jgi:DNA-binding transcriptional regulator YdaS (Cro superfamily)